jgi:hypothetical protein
MNTQDLVTRGLRHSALRRELDRQGLLFAHERELLLDAADALLFDEPEAEIRRIEALALLDALETNGRRTEGEVTRLRDDLTGCGETETELVPA